MVSSYPHFTFTDSRLGVAGGNGGTGGAGVTGKCQRQFARMHVRIEHRHELIQIGQEVVAEHQRVRGALHQLDLRRLDHDFGGGLHLDLALLHRRT